MYIHAYFSSRGGDDLTRAVQRSVPQHALYTYLNEYINNYMYSFIHINMYTYICASHLFPRGCDHLAQTTQRSVLHHALYTYLNT